MKPPLVEPDPCAVLFGARQAETGACRPLGVHEPALSGIGDRGMRDQDLAWRERTRVVVLQFRTNTEEGHLKSQRPGNFIQPAGDVPPFQPEIRMAALVA